MELENCPIRKDALRVIATSNDLRRAIRRLRRDLQNCQRCDCYEECSLWASFRHEIDAAVADVRAEWGRVDEQ